MKIDKQTVEKLTAMTDEKLWQMIKYIASSSGIKLPPETQMPSDMDAVRRALSNLNDDDIKRAEEILKAYRGGAK